MFSEIFSREFFRDFRAVYAQIVITAAACASFAVILFICIVFPKTRRALRKIFAGVAAFSCFTEIAICLSGLVFSDKAEVFTGLAVFLGSSATFFGECGVLNILGTEKRELNGVRFSSPPAHKDVGRTVALSDKNMQKREKKAAISEIPLRKTLLVQMEKPGDCEEILGVNYLKQCIEILKGKELSEGDALKLSAAESLVKNPAERDFGYRKRISDGCGKIITLLAKYK